MILPLFTSRRYDEARASYRKVIDLDPRASAAYSALGIVEHKRGNFQDAIARYHEVRFLLPLLEVPPSLCRWNAQPLIDHGTGSRTCTWRSSHL